MALFTIADLHLSFSCPDKSMDLFGNRWIDYVNKIKKRWESVVAPNDTIVIPGDISWALTLDEAADDLLFLHSLPGTKVLLKGNHDFWWTSYAKMKQKMDDLQIDSIYFLHNNSFVYQNYAICGTRGWYQDERLQSTGQGTVDYHKIVRREILRLQMSFDSIQELHREKIVFFHFPPIWNDFYCTEIIDVLKRYEIKKCFFGHIHGQYSVPLSFEYEGINFRLISSDTLDFTPYLISK